MGKTLIDTVVKDRTKLFRGAAMLIVADPAVTDFPTRMEDVMATTGETKYTLVEGWTQLGLTTTDGVTVTRAVEIMDGIDVDQANAPLGGGEPKTWGMTMEATLANTDLEAHKFVWGGGDIGTIAAAEGKIAQHVLMIDAPSSLPTWILGIFQEDTETGRLRMEVYRNAKVQPDSGRKISRDAASGLPLNMLLSIDPSIEEGSGQFGAQFTSDVEA